MCSASYGDCEVNVAVLVAVAVVRSCCCDHNIDVTVACSDQHVMGGAVGAMVALLSCCAPR